MTMNELNEELAAAQKQALHWEEKVREIKKKREAFAQERVKQGLKPHDCCNIESNLELRGEPIKVKGLLVDGKAVSATASLRVCKVCKANHHEAVADPGHFGLKG